MTYSPAKVLVTGALGQDGAYLCEVALRHGCAVVGGVRAAAEAASERSWRLGTLGIAERVPLTEMDLTDPSSIDAALRTHEPDIVFNLAAQSSVARSFAHPVEAAQTNALGASYLFEAARCASHPVRVVQATSADIMAAGLDGPVRAGSPYAAAKAFAHLMARVYRASLGTFVSSAILYNHESPLRGPEFVSQKIVAALVAIRRGQQQKLLLGNLDAHRDWSHARDIAEGLWLIGCAESAGEYALGSGETHSVREFVDLAARAAGFTLRWEGSGMGEVAVDESSGRPLIGIDPGLFRPVDTSHHAAELHRAQALGWSPRTSMGELIREMIDFETEGHRRSPA